MRFVFTRYILATVRRIECLATDCDDNYLGNYCNCLSKNNMPESQVLEQDGERWVGLGDTYDASTLGGNSLLITGFCEQRHCRGPDCFHSKLSVQGHLHSTQPWKTEVVFPLEQRASRLPI